MDQAARGRVPCVKCDGVMEHGGRRDERVCRSERDVRTPALALAPLTPLQLVARLTAAPVHDQNFVECVDFVALSLRS